MPEERLTKLEKKLEEVEGKINKMEIKIALTENNTENICKNITEIKDITKSISDEINRIKMKPLNKYEDIAKTIGNLIIGAIVGMVLLKIGLK